MLESKPGINAGQINSGSSAKCLKTQAALLLDKLRKRIGRHSSQADSAELDLVRHPRPTPRAADGGSAPVHRVVNRSQAGSGVAYDSDQRVVSPMRLRFTD